MNTRQRQAALEQAIVTEAREESRANDLDPYTLLVMAETLNKLIGRIQCPCILHNALITQLIELNAFFRDEVARIKRGDPIA